jgi:hypothetical protein
LLYNTIVKDGQRNKHSSLPDRSADGFLAADNNRQTIQAVIGLAAFDSLKKNQLTSASPYGLFDAFFDAIIAI